jgi:hypothetical protein
MSLYFGSAMRPRTVDVPEVHDARSRMVDGCVHLDLPEPDRLRSGTAASLVLSRVLPTFEAAALAFMPASARLRQCPPSLPLNIRLA